jgi:hypothetical protein
MNLKDFSLLKEDEMSYMIGHPHGKFMNIPKKGMSDKAHALIKRLKSNPQHFAHGGEEKKEQEITDLILNNSSEQPVPEPPPVTTPAAPPEKSLADTIESGVIDAARSAGNAIGALIDRPIEGIKSMLGMEEKKEQPKAPEQPKLPEPEKETKIAPPKQPDPYEKALQDSQNAITGAMKTEQDLTKNLIAESGKIQKNLQNMKTPEQLARDYQTQDATLAKQFADNHIDPNRFYHNMSTGNKILAGIGMVLGGVGSGFTGQPNPALEMMKQAIDRDIEAQKSDQNQAFTLWKMNREKLGSDIQANLATQNQYLAASKVMVERAMMGVNNAQAIKRGIQLLQTIVQKQELNNILRGNLSGKPGTEAEYVQRMQKAKTLDKAVGDDMEVRFRPGKGVFGKTPTPKQLEQLEGISIFNMLAKEAEDYADTVGTGWPFSAGNEKAESMRKSLYDALPAMRGIGGNTDAKLDMFSSMITSPASYRKEVFKALLEQLKSDAQIREKAIERDTRFMPFDQSDRLKVARAWAEAHRGNPDAEEILKRLGAK